MSTTALRIAGRSYPVRLPSPRDPRLHVASVIVTIHVLGQVGLHFVVSVPQILTAILTCAVLEIAIAFRREGAIIWPASAMLTGSGVALILRVVGTPPGDHWSTFGLGLYAAVAGLSLLSKYAFRHQGSPVFNPSNIGLVGTFVVLGSQRVEPLDFWWAPPNAWMLLAYAVILTGGLVITGRLGLIPLAVTFWVALATGVGILAASGHCMTANWAFLPVCGNEFWRVIVTSPEVLIFLFFMITDPRTVPKGRTGRILFGMLVAVVGTLLLAPQTTEFGTKVGLIAGLVVACAARPIVERIVAWSQSGNKSGRTLTRLIELAHGSAAEFSLVRLAWAVGCLTTVAVAIVLAGVPARGPGAMDAAMPEMDQSRVDPATFPPISVEQAVTDWDPTLSGPTMQGIMLTVAQNLEAENEALLRADPSLLDRVDHGDRLVEMQERIRDAVAAGTVRIAHYRPDSVNVALLRPFGRQDGLSLGFKTRGLLTTETYDDAGHLQSTASSPFSLTFVARRATGARWLTVAVLPEVGDQAGAQ